MPSMETTPEEFVSARDASRRLGLLIDQLVAGSLAKAVIVHRNKPLAVVVTLERYEQLERAEETDHKAEPAPVSQSAWELGGLPRSTGGGST